MSRIILWLLMFSSTPLASTAAFTQTEFVRVQTGMFNDPFLKGFCTYAMRVTADTDWTNTDLLIELTSGTMNHIEAMQPIGGMGPTAGVAGLGDTAVFSPRTDLGNVLSSPSMTLLAADHLETPTTFAANWFNTSTGDIGTFDIAMLTFSHDANGTIRFRTISGSQVEEGGFTSGAVPTWIIRSGGFAFDDPDVCPIPEPTSLMLSALCALLWLAPRRFV